MDVSKAPDSESKDNALVAHAAQVLLQAAGAEAGVGGGVGLHKRFSELWWLA